MGIWSECHNQSANELNATDLPMCFEYGVYKSFRVWGAIFVFGTFWYFFSMIKYFRFLRGHLTIDLASSLRAEGSPEI